MYVVSVSNALPSKSKASTPSIWQRGFVRRERDEESKRHEPNVEEEEAEDVGELVVVRQEVADPKEVRKARAARAKAARDEGVE